MVGWHGCEQVPGAGDGQGNLVCCSPWGRKESDATERLNSERASGNSLQLRGELSVQGTCLSVRLSLSSRSQDHAEPHVVSLIYNFISGYRNKC